MTSIFQQIFDKTYKSYFVVDWTAETNSFPAQAFNSDLIYYLIVTNTTKRPTTDVKAKNVTFMPDLMLTLGVLHQKI